MFTILVVENNRKLNSSYCTFIKSQTWNAVPAHDASEALASFEENQIDIMLSNVELPGIDGVMLVEAVRKMNPNLPIMMLTELDDFKSKQRAFAAGCDDYMVDPINLNELALRVTALLRRAHAASKRRIVVGDAVLDSDTLTVVEGTDSTILPPKEFMVLFKLCSSPERIFSRRDIMDDVWGLRAESGERTVDVHIKRLRKRFENSQSFRIDTVRGLGYKATIVK